ncbi:MAG: methionyl-tRNA formyltransferase [Pseudonocardiaceae bacterium]|nr:methionyl-tRNA formyltransferase [Pseudonocardiaceae bacterium]
MRVVAFGYQTWGFRTVEALLNSEHELALVITHPKSDHAYESIWDDSVADLAEQHDVPVVLRNRPDDQELVSRIKEAEPDIIVATNWRTWIPPQIFNLPPHGTLNVHDSLLPAYAGFAPINWAVLNGEEEVGVTAHIMNDELDAGDIVLQQSVKVQPRDTATDLVRATTEFFGPITLAALDRIASGRTDWMPQDRSKATYFHKRSVEDSRIDWTWPAPDIVNLVRAQSDPYPNAFAFYGEQRIRVLSASVTDKPYGGMPGRVFVRHGDGVVVTAGTQARKGHSPGLLIERVRTEDGSEYTGREFFTTMGGYLTSHPVAR